LKYPIFAATALLAGASAAADPVNRVALQRIDDRAAAVHVTLDERLDLAARLAAPLTGDDAPLVPLAPRIVVGQGDDRRSRTFVRVLNPHGVVEAQFLAFDSNVRGGVRVAAGRDASGAVVLAATPFDARQDGVVRLFNDAGGFHASFVSEGTGGGAVQIVAGDFLPQHPGDELAVVPERAGRGTTDVAFHALDGTPLAAAAAPVADRAVLMPSLHPAGGGKPDRLWLHAAPDHTVYLIDATGGPTETRDLSAIDNLERGDRVYPTAFGPNRAAAVRDEPLLSTVLRVEPRGEALPRDAGRLENQFFIFPGDWAGDPKKPHQATGGPHAFAEGVYGHFRMDLGNPAINRPALWDTPNVWPKIEAASVKKWGPLLRPLPQQPRRMWEPCITHRMNWKQALPWAERDDPSTGHKRFLALTRGNNSSSYGEFGRANEFHNFTYAYGDVALDQLYGVPLRQFLRRLAVRFREHPERIVSLEPVHEHEISVDGQGPDKGSVGDYHPLMIAGFRDYLHRLFGNDAALAERFGFTAAHLDKQFDAPRDQNRGPWDAYDLKNELYAQWILYQRYVVNRRIADGYFAAVAAGFPPEVVKGHQIPDTYAVGSTETFSKRKARFTPVDYALTAGVGFGFTRYGVWFKRPQNMLKGAVTSGFRSVVMGEYQSLTPDVKLALDQLNHVFASGVTAIHVMHWPASHDKGFNAAMKTAIGRFLKDQRPRPGLAGGIGRVVPVTDGDRRYDIASLGTGADRTGLLKSLRDPGGWEGTVYSVPFRSAIRSRKLRERPQRTDGDGRRYLIELDAFDVGEQAEVTFRGSGPPGDVRFTVLRDGAPLPGTAVKIPVTAEPRSHRFVLRSPLPAGDLELAVDLPAGFNLTEPVEARRHTEAVARLHRDQHEGSPHRGGIEFAVIPSGADLR